VNSRGVEFGHRASLRALCDEIEAARHRVEAACLVDGIAIGGAAVQRRSPIDAAAVGTAREATTEHADRAMAVAQTGFRTFGRLPVEDRANMLRRAADLLEARRGLFLHLLQVEGGRTLDDALAELREAVDFCRYYAEQALRLFVPHDLPGPTGEHNALHLRPRGVFVAISPWNFPLAIFMGQVTAALASGNCVVAKPAEQTPLIAYEAVRLLHEAGVPKSALHLVLGAGEIGARLVASPRVAGVVFTGSTDVARHINRALAEKDGPIVPLIAETGGINAMIVDATALPEQVSDDVITSAFRSAGQRCSALRILFVQEDVADRMIEMICGAARELQVGDPRDPATHVGPLIDAEAKARIVAWVDVMRRMGHARDFSALRDVAQTQPGDLYVAPTIIDLPQADLLKQEVFGPVLHVVRYRAERLDRVLEAIAATGYGLTLGIHSRIDATVDRIVARLAVGNVYVNRNIIGAVVGAQPFGGTGLSGTGPKAGGPHYLARFATEQTVTINTAASGGNASLIGMRDAV
jgi:RHH-type proline utilization regulon transcriptional repressor/proline dehydrogenase/delta 1-pyrroline-5-carboxylate dehydrogenase